jgi:hypothetical protein
MLGRKNGQNLSKRVFYTKDRLGTYCITENLICYCNCSLHAVCFGADETAVILILIPTLDDSLSVAM